MMTGMSAADSGWIREQEDTVFMRVVGPFQVEQAQEVERYARRLQTRYGRYFIISDITHTGLATPDARRQSMELSRVLPAAGIAVYGGSVITRTWVMLLSRGINLVLKRPVRMEFMKNEQEAIAWVASLRAQVTPTPTPAQPQSPT